MSTYLYLDTEYNGFGGQLISMALVPVTNNNLVSQPFYEVMELPDSIDPWVKINVIPKLRKEPVNNIMFRTKFQRFIFEFVNPIVVFDWYEDFVHFCNQLKGYDYSSSLNYPFRAHHVCGLPSIKENENTHNALYDATRLWKQCKEANLKFF